MAPTENGDERGGHGKPPGSSNNNILFDQSKNEQISLTSGFKKLQMHLKNWKLSNHREEITAERLTPFRVFMIANPREKFTPQEYDSMKRYIDNGGSILLTLNEGGESRQMTNVNTFLKNYGIEVNDDSVIRAAYYKYFYPKEALILDGVLNRAIAENAHLIAATTPAPKNQKKSQNNVVVDKSLRAQVACSLEFVYPFGASLTVQPPSVPVLSTGTTCLPTQRAICAFYTSPSKSGGRLCVCGSTMIFHDTYLEKEQNRRLLDVVIEFLTNSSFRLNEIDAEVPDVSDEILSPDLIAMSEMLKCSLHDVEELPKDVRKLLDTQLYNLDLTLIPKMIRAYEELQMKHEPLTLIKPQFEVPMPSLKPAVFPPIFRDCEPPSLELFDLEDYFASETSRLNQLTNKCSEQDLDLFIKEFGNIAGISSRMPVDQRGGKQILEFIVTQLFEFKRMYQPGMDDDYLGGHNPLDSGRYTFGTGGGIGASNFDRLIVDS
ncbi:unnamed protein product [Adineta steineri]|uniref:Intraflagellar transport protein 52-like protein n=2 Tax=Adineta steineri TaxID=433720 RepID=A0A815L723_9BILA|nr:unnamed protein product [Adineta steineri]CAF1176349.1 unnamed protein product [Adineta steineri]CAF1405487.1 unnamed protein product [Adineta steineri]CAF1615705.1 unnamed protein product [Adineta steineri]CAF3813222.1 unnamed protein product [Adineta steineri]